jgi:hypothetical protein
MEKQMPPTGDNFSNPDEVSTNRLRLTLIKGIDDPLIADISRLANACEKKWLLIAYIELGAKQGTPTLYELLKEYQLRKGKSFNLVLRLSIDAKHVPHAFAVYHNTPRYFKNTLLSILCTRGYASTLKPATVNPVFADSKPAKPEERAQQETASTNSIDSKLDMPTSATRKPLSVPDDLVNVDDERRNQMMKNLLASNARAPTR